MSYFAGILVMALLAVIQSSVLARFPFLDGTPTLILLACVSWTLTGRVVEAMAFAFSGGLFLDLLSGSPFGASAMALVACVYLASLSEGRFWEAHPLAPLGVVAAASSVYYSVTIAALWLAGRPIDPSLALSQVVLPSTFLNVLLAVPAAQLADRVREAAFPPAVRMG